MTFTSHVKLLGPDGSLAPLKSVLLKASSPVNVAVNGRLRKVTTDGVAVTTDALGTSTVVHNVADINSSDSPSRTIPAPQRQFSVALQSPLILA